MTELEYFDSVRKKYDITKSRKNIILIGTPNHGNLGDHAIAYATLKLLSQLFSHEHIFEINMQDFASDIEAIYHLINKNDIIILQGGGNLGNVYIDDEMIRRYVVARFKQNKIIMFPQSVFFTDDKDGMDELERSRKIYRENTNLYLIARDEKSEIFLKNNFDNAVYKLPDIALTLPGYDKQCVRKGVLLCLRSDMESTLNASEKEKIDQFFEKKFGDIKKINTVVEYRIEDFDRETELKKKWDEFRSAKLVVTDRLHGVIFCIITRTPCIAFLDLNKKIEGVMQDFDKLNNIFLVGKLEKLDDVLENLKNTESDYHNNNIIKLYKLILNRILKERINDSQDLEEISISEIFNLTGYWKKQYYESEKQKKLFFEEKERINREYDKRIKEIKEYKIWVEKLDKREQEKDIEIKELTKQYNERVQENKEYKNWVDKLEECNRKLRDEIERINSEYNQRVSELHEYMDWVNKLQNQNR